MLRCSAKHRSPARTRSQGVQDGSEGILVGLKGFPRVPLKGVYGVPRVPLKGSIRGLGSRGLG